MSFAHVDQARSLSIVAARSRCISARGAPRNEQRAVNSRIDFSAAQSAKPQVPPRVSTNQFFADLASFASTEPLCRAAETDPEVASLLEVHPRNADGAILLVHLLG